MFPHGWGGIASITGTPFGAPCATMGHAAEAGVSPAELAPKLNLIKMATEYSTDSTDNMIRYVHVLYVLIQDTDTYCSTLTRRHCEHKFWAQPIHLTFTRRYRPPLLCTRAFVIFFLFPAARSGVRGEARSVRPDMLQPVGINPTVCPIFFSLSLMQSLAHVVTFFHDEQQRTQFTLSVSPIPLPHGEGVGFDPPHQCFSRHYSSMQ